MSANHPAPPDLSVVISAYGEAELLDRCLAAVERELSAARPPLRAEIVVADDATPGGLPDWLPQKYPQARFEISERNLGFAGNTNRGVAAARGALLCLLNTDMYVAPGWFDGCLGLLDDERLFAVCGRIREPSGRNDGYKELVFEGDSVSVESFSDSDPRCETSSLVPYASGGGSFFHRDRFLELGGFDPRFTPYYWEDADLGVRAWSRGYRIHYDPVRVVEHDHQGTIGKDASRRVGRSFRRNRRRFVFKNQLDLPLTRLVWSLLLAPAASALLRLRVRHAIELLAELRSLRGVARARRDARIHQVHNSADLKALWGATT